MDIVYAAEKPSIANLLGNYVKRSVTPEEIKVTENPDETGSFLIDWRLRSYVLSPSGEIASEMPNSHACEGTAESSGPDKLASNR